MGVCYNEVLGIKQVLMQQGCNQTVREIERYGYTAVELDYSTIYDATHSGIHCSVASIWRER